MNYQSPIYYNPHIVTFKVFSTLGMERLETYKGKNSEKLGLATIYQSTVSCLFQRARS